MYIKTSNTELIKPLLKDLYLPPIDSHKGQNGRVLVIGGSSLFHAASIWAAEIASFFVDIVHYSSTQENSEIFLSLKKKFHNGIVVAKKDLEFYVKEDDAILVGPGMVRKLKVQSEKLKIPNFLNLINIQDEGEYTYYLTKYLIDTFPDKRFVFDAGSLQMMKPEWLLKLKQKPIITPHQIEFERLFDVNIMDKSVDDKINIVENKAKEFQVVILLKAVVDIVTDGNVTYVIEGGNTGLTKGGTGDLLAGLIVAFYTKNNQILSSTLASFLLKRTADELFKTNATWYNNNKIIEKIPSVLKGLVF